LAAAQQSPPTPGLLEIRHWTIERFDRMAFNFWYRNTVVLLQCI